MATVDDALYEWLTNDAGLVALVVDRVYPDLLPEGATFPALTFQEVSMRADYSHDGGDTGLDRSRFQFDFYATTRIGARVVADALRAAISGKRESHLGVMFMAPRLTNALSGYEDALNVYRLIHDYEMIYRV